MTTDERLDRLADQTTKNAEQISQLTTGMSQLTTKMSQLTANLDSMRGLMNEIMHGTAILLSRAQTHDTLLAEHGKRITNLEK